MYASRDLKNILDFLPLYTKFAELFISMNIVSSLTVISTLGEKRFRSLSNPFYRIWVDILKSKFLRASKKKNSRYVINLYVQ